MDPETEGVEDGQGVGRDESVSPGVGVLGKEAEGDGVKVPLALCVVVTEGVKVEVVHWEADTVLDCEPLSVPKLVVEGVGVSAPMVRVAREVADPEKLPLPLPHTVGEGV